MTPKGRKRDVGHGMCTSKKLPDLCHNWVLAKRRVRIKAGDKDTFRTELFRLIREIDTRWPQETFWHGPQGHTQRDFSHHPTLAKYLSGVKFFPQEFRGAREFRWITFPNRGGAYLERSAVNALLETIAGAIDQYGRG